jgi:hypothetical protein
MLHDIFITFIVPVMVPALAIADIPSALPAFARAASDQSHIAASLSLTELSIVERVTPAETGLYMRIVPDPSEAVPALVGTRMQKLLVMAVERVGATAVLE